MLKGKSEYSNPLLGQVCNLCTITFIQTIISSRLRPSACNIKVEAHCPGKPFSIPNYAPAIRQACQTLWGRCQNHWGDRQDHWGSSQIHWGNAPNDRLNMSKPSGTNTTALETEAHHLPKASRQMSKNHRPWS